MHAQQVRTMLPGITVNVPTSNTQLLPRRKNRYQAFIQNSDGSVSIRVGSPAELTAGRGITVAAGEIYEFNGPGAISAIAASSTVDVFIVEQVGAANDADVPAARQVTVDSSRPLILPRDPRRLYAVIQNTDGSDPIMIGGRNTVTLTAGGIKLSPGKYLKVVGSAAVYGIAGGTNEVQQLTVGGTPTGGTYTLTFAGFPVTLAYNANAAAIEAALRTNPALYPDNVTVSGTNPYTITFVKEQGARDVAAITTTAALTGGDNEVQQVSITGTPTGGTFTLTFDGQTTAGIAYNANAAAVESALEALSNLAPADVACTGGALPGSAVNVTFGGVYASMNVPQMTANSAGLTGGTSPTAAVTTTTPGADAVIATTTPGVALTAVVNIREERSTV